MEYRVKLLPRAERDLVVIYQRIGARDSAAAMRWYRGLRKAIRTLRENPDRCPVTQENQDLRHLLYGKKPNVYRVIYRVADKQNQVHVLHIRHGAQKAFKRGDLA